jgi:hypothetical protein
MLRNSSKPQITATAIIKVNVIQPAQVQTTTVEKATNDQTIRWGRVLNAPDFVAIGQRLPFYGF